MLPTLRSSARSAHHSPDSRAMRHSSPLEMQSFQMFMKSKRIEHVENETDLLSAIRALPNRNQQNLLTSLARLEDEIIRNSSRDLNIRKKKLGMPKVRHGTAHDLKKYGTVLQDTSVRPGKGKISTSLIKIGRAMKESYNDEMTSLTLPGVSCGVSWLYHKIISMAIKCFS